MRVLLWVCLDTHFREMVRVARLLRSRPGCEPVLLFVCRYPLLDRDLALCRSEGLPVEGRFALASPTPAPGAAANATAGNPASPAPKPRFERLRRVYRALGGRRVVGRILDWDFLLAYRHYLAALREARETVARLRPALLVLPEDNVEYATAPLIKAADEQGVPSVVVPYTLADALEPAEAYWGNPSHGMRLPLNRLMGALYPRWRYRHRGRDLLRLPAGHVWAQERLGLAPPAPWILNSGYSDAVAVESEAVREYYERAGLDPRRLKVTGSLRQDELWRRLPTAPQERRRLLEELGLDDGRPLFLCALPPNQYPERRPDCEFEEYEELVRFWFASFARLPDGNAVVNLHPRIPYEEMRHLEGGRVRIVQGDVARLLPLCDCFVASVSATICLAIACGKPVVNYDVYRFRYRDFDGVPGVVNLDSREGFVATLHRLAEDPGFRQELAGRQGQAQTGWGRLDGKAGDRLLALFEEVAARRGPGGR